MSLNMKNWRAIFISNSKDLMQELICVKNNSYPASIKNKNGGINFFLCDNNELTTPPI